MTITVSSDAGGTYGSIAVNGVEKLRLNADGSATLDGNPVQRYKVLGTKPTTSGTTIDFSPNTDSAIPSWANRVTLSLQDVTTNGGSLVIVRLGDSSGFYSSGYAGSATYYISGTQGSTDPLSSGFGIFIGGTNIYRFGTITFTRLTGNKWLAVGQVSHAGGCSWVTGVKVLTGSLDRLRITTVNGTDTFTQGEVSLIAEG